MQFFDRYYREVFGFEEAGITDRLTRVREQLTEPFIKLFDESLVQAGRRLIENPRDRAAKVDFITMYHMIIEGTLALTGQFFLLRYFEEDQKALPGFVEGFSRIAQDEHRHVAYGTWYLQQQSRDPEMKERIQAAVDRAPAGGGRRAGAARLHPRRGLHLPRLHQPGADRVRVHGAHPAVEGDRGRPAGGRVGTPEVS